MTESNDGFYISEQDLKLRGQEKCLELNKVEMKDLCWQTFMMILNILRCAREEAKICFIES